MLSLPPVVSVKGPMLSIAIMSKEYVKTLNFKSGTPFPCPNFPLAQISKLFIHTYIDRIYHIWPIKYVLLMI